MTPDPLTAALDQLASHHELISHLDNREVGHFAALSGQLTQITVAPGIHLPATPPGKDGQMTGNQPPGAAALARPSGAFQQRDARCRRSGSRTVICHRPVPARCTVRPARQVRP